jgi:hypothetical protein
MQTPSSSTWLCASPVNALKATDAIAAYLEVPKGFERAVSLSLTARQMREVHLKHDDLFKIVVQKEGDVIDVVPGWMHAVANEGRGIFKLAVEKLQVEKLPYTLWARNLERKFHEDVRLPKNFEPRHYIAEYVAPGQMLMMEMLQTLDRH